MKSAKIVMVIEDEAGATEYVLVKASTILNFESSQVQEIKDLGLCVTGESLREATGRGTFSISGSWVDERIK
jgi:hypothetical protein